MQATISAPPTHHEILVRTESITAYYNPENRSVWHYMHAHPRPCVTQALLNETRQVQETIYRGDLEVDFFVLASSIPKVFNLGGDLSLFRTCVMNQDWDQLSHYAEGCIDVLNGFVCGFNRQVITLALMQGDALGGGFEVALACDFMVGEASSKLGFPEVIFNLFPGMGAYSLLARKLGPQPAQKMILSGSLYAAEDLHARGLIDMISPVGRGVSVVENFIRDTQRQLRGYKGFLDARRRVAFWPSRAELMDVVRDWIICVKQVTERDLRMMDRLVTAQNRLKVMAA